jgi:predicted RNase H-like HicB family nuclease
MKHIVAIIEKAEDGGYAIYSKDVNGLFGSGLTEAEAKTDFLEVIEEQAEFYKEKHGQYPDWYQDGYEIEYRYDMSGFFLSFPFINASEFAKSIGINPSLMRKYKNGLASAGENQKNLIQEKFTDIVNRLERVKFG